MVTFADTSHYQTVDLAAYKAAGFDRIAMKATGGATDGSLRFADSTFAVRWRQAGQMGLHRIAYHFARNNNTGGDEFAWCWSQIQTAGGMRPGDVLCYDQEDNRGASAGVARAALAWHAAAVAAPEHAEHLAAALTAGRGITDRRLGPAFAALIERTAGDIGPNWRAARQRTKEFVAAAVRAGVTTGWVYSGKWYLEPAGIVAADLPAGWQQLWISDYTAGQADTAIEVPAGWARSQFVARQYTDAANLPGIPGTDANRVLREWLGGPAPTPTPTQIPAGDAMYYIEVPGESGMLVGPGGAIGVDGPTRDALRAMGVVSQPVSPAQYYLILAAVRRMYLAADIQQWATVRHDDGWTLRELLDWAPGQLAALATAQAATDAKLDALAAAVANIQVTGGTVDPQAIAKAVLDEQHRRDAE